MRIDFDWLPMATPFDPAEEPPGDLDPLGTLGHAERLGETLLPGFTVRMWRSRLLTFAAIASAVADRTVKLMGDRENARLEARLAFERLFVSAVVRMAGRDPAIYENAPRRLPGRTLAKKALLEGEPLTRTNFLKGQAVNGPFGVIARLARQLEFIDDNGHMGRKAVELLMAWSDDEDLPGILDEDVGTGLAGAAWMAEAAKRTALVVARRDWPNSNHRIWELLARHMRPDHIGPKERRVLLLALRDQPIRQRVVGLLKKRVDLFQEGRDLDRGKLERLILLDGVRPELNDGPTDRLIAAVIEIIDAYEQASGLFQQTFEGIIWALKARGGRARPETILSDTRLRSHLEKTLREVKRLVTLLERSIEVLGDQPSVDRVTLVEPITRLRDDFLAASPSVPSLADTVLQRHERVQKQKSKALWIEREIHWTLMPGENRVSAEAIPIWQETYLHPFKIPNAYSMLGDLGEVAVEVQDVEE